MRRLAFLRVVALLLSCLLVVVGCGDDASDDPAQPATPSSSSDEPGDDGTDGGDTSCTTVVPPPAATRAVLVPDPRPGDLRVDPNADTLPADYNPPPAAVVQNDLAYGPDPAHRLDLYLPEQASAPVILFLHSGGWVGGTRAAVPPMVLRFLELGYAVASADYRLAPDHPFPSAVQDAKRAVRWLKATDDLGPHLDQERVAVYGTSAGGHLAAMVGATPGRFEPIDLPPELAVVDSSVVGIVSVVGPTDLESFYVQPHPWAEGLTEALLGCRPCDATTLSMASPTPYLSGDLPPAYWAYGVDDLLVDAASQGEVIAAQWAEYADADHSWLDLVDECSHNVNPSLVNQRWVEGFIDFAMEHHAGVDNSTQ